LLVDTILNGKNVIGKVRTYGVPAILMSGKFHSSKGDGADHVDTVRDLAHTAGRRLLLGRLPAPQGN
jgi:hypothetical protein